MEIRPKCTGIVDISQWEEENQTKQCQPKRIIIGDNFYIKKCEQSGNAKLNVSSPKSKTDSTSYLIDVVWDGTHWWLQKSINIVVSKYIFFYGSKS